MTEDAAIPGWSRVELFRTPAPLPDGERLFAFIAYLAAPTIIGLKPATMLCFANGRRQLLDEWNAFGGMVGEDLGLLSVELRRRPGSVTVLFYKPNELDAALGQEEANILLAESGFSKGGGREAWLCELASRFTEGCPHEVGLFLGIPARDVRSFMADRIKGCQLTGYWKVYHEPEAAKELFAGFERARRIMGDRILRGELRAKKTELLSA